MCGTQESDKPCYATFRKTTEKLTSNFEHLQQLLLIIYVIVSPEVTTQDVQFYISHSLRTTLFMFWEKLIQIIQNLKCRLLKSNKNQVSIYGCIGSFLHARPCNMGSPQYDYYHVCLLFCICGMCMCSEQHPTACTQKVLYTLGVKDKDSATACLGSH